jgi:IclR family transcriptional regulator, KDG regulon repressor
MTAANIHLAYPQDTVTASPGTGTAVRSVDRALMVLEALASASSPSPLAELADATGLPKATVHRLLNTLAVRGFAARADEGYMLGSRLFLLAADARQADRLQRLFMPFLLELHVRTRAAVSVGVLSGSQVLYSGSVHGYQGTPRSRDAVPAHCTALGKLLLAYQPDAARGLGEELPRLTSKTVATMAELRLQLADIRRRGVAFAHEERIRGEVEAAVPVFAHHKQVVTGLSVAGAAGSLDVESAVMHLTRIAPRASAHCREEAAAAGLLNRRWLRRDALGAGSSMVPASAASRSTVLACA